MRSRTTGVRVLLTTQLSTTLTLQTGGAPYDDLVKGWEYVRDNLDFVDTDHGVAAGASFGGFMINWIQGSDLGREFKALVTHDGTFVADAKISTEELWFMEHDVSSLPPSPSQCQHMLTNPLPTVQRYLLGRSPELPPLGPL